MQIPRSRFAVSIGYGSERIASYEAARAPVPYLVFRAIAERYKLNPRWLATGVGGPTLNEPFNDAAFAEGLSARALFSTVYDEFIAGEMLKREETSRAQRESFVQTLQEIVQGLSHVPAHGAVRTAALELVHKISGLIDQGQQELLFRQLVSSKLYSDQAGSGEKISKPTVDNPVGFDILAGMSSQHGYWKALVKRLRALTAAPGAKAQLARELKTSRQAVNKWLSGKGAPSAELTLRLLHWVELAGASKTQDPGCVTALPGSKTQVRKSRYEKQTQVRKKG